MDYRGPLVRTTDPTATAQTHTAAPNSNRPTTSRACPDLKPDALRLNADPITFAANQKPIGTAKANAARIEPMMPASP